MRSVEALDPIPGQTQDLIVRHDTHDADRNGRAGSKPYAFPDLGRDLDHERPPTAAEDHRSIEQTAGDLHAHDHAGINPELVYILGRYVELHRRGFPACT